MTSSSGCQSKSPTSDDEAAAIDERSSTSAKKWICGDCTFENFMASSKCTMCRSSRSSEAEENNLANNRKTTSSGGHSDIFKLGTNSKGSSSISPPPQGHNVHVSSGSGRSNSPFDMGSVKEQIKSYHYYQQQQNKWACFMCTYLNWPRSVRCAQCLHPRRRVSPVVSRNSPISPRSGNDNNNPMGTGGRPQSCSPPPVSHHMENPHLSTVVETKLEAASGSFSQQDNNNDLYPEKWNCHACTYENWPKSKCCVICGVAKRLRPEEEPSTSQNLKNNENEAGFNQENNCDYERRLRQLRRRLRETDWSWLSACMGVAEGDVNPVEAYLNSGGDPTRKLTNPETALLNRNRSAVIFEAGHTLVHLAIKLHKEDMLATLLSQFEGQGPSITRVKCVPSYVAPDLDNGIRRHITQSVRQRKGSFPCYYMCEWATFSMPSEIEDLPPATQEQLYSEILDKDAQKELEEDCEPECPSSAINWSEELRISLGSRLHALWNRSAGDCLLDSVLQATWGVFDRDNTLRRAMADSLHEAGQLFYPRWKAWELQQAMELDYTIDDAQLSEDWSGILSLASKPGASLEQVHVFCLAHVLRRPIIVYGVKYVKSWRGENLGYARFEGVYLPLLWESSFCSKSPIALGYTRGHFCALVPPEPVLKTLMGAVAGADLGASKNDGYFSNTASGAAASGDPQTQTITSMNSDVKTTFLPLVTADRKQFLPIPYLSQSEAGNTESILRHWLDVRVTDSGLIVALQKIAKPPLLVAQMTEEWLNHYRKLAQSSTAPFSSRAASGSTISNNNNCFRRVRRTSPLSSSRSPSSAVSPSVASSLSDRAQGSTSATSVTGQVTQQANNQAGTNQTVSTTAHNLIVVNNTCYSSDGDSDEE